MPHRSTPLSPQKGSKSLQEALLEATQLLEKAGVDSPRLDAEVLLSEVLSLPRHQLYARLNEPIDTASHRTFRRLVKKRAARVPLQYIIGHVEFMSMDFLTEEGVFIPRPETELVVEAVLQRAELTQSTIIMDIGAGSGNIAVSLAVNLPHAEVYASDTSKKALRLARFNAQRYLVEDKISFLKGPLYAAFQGLGLEGRVDFIASNPPYVPEGEWKGLQPEVRDHESPEALVAGKDGMDCYRDIIKGASLWLRPGGWLVLELGEGQAAPISGLILKEENLGGVEAIKDLQDIERVIVARRGGGIRLRRAER
ncbi:MAG TPA: peptide chain release factor N(5)-glutamine methyltransferase [Candidatus Tripitaka californicus]|uniref:peptide chain release factor N(5)-glutamine methyltransferase n=1 Tax=Candidatus Tripitaka californicus TaxID=3367616 RepID=UPI004025E266